LPRSSEPNASTAWRKSLLLVLRASAAGWRIREVPVTYRPRIGRSKVTGTALGTIRAGRDMARIARALT
jgi:hypothetical protein